ncbi:MAG TPA: ComEC family competence protein, partial [Chitinophagales bacterium]|nr:ComEC family competence protein [Chitinophagales bacterium]
MVFFIAKMLEFLKEISFVRLVIPFCLGIVSYVFLPFDSGHLIALSVFSACCLFLLLTIFIPALQKSHRLQWLSGICMYVLFLPAGYLLAAVRTEINSDEHYSRFLQNGSRALLQIDEPLVEKDKSWKTTAKVIAVVNGNEAATTIGTVLIFLRKDSASSALKYGDRLWVVNKFAELPPPKNPREFNYKRFMGFKQVYRQIFLSSGDWMKAAEKGGIASYGLILELRQLLADILRKHITDDASYSVGVSLILGMREKLDDELIKAYSSSGAMHVLAVSGLHVAIIYAIFNSV